MADHDTIDPHSQTWRAIKAWAAARQESSRATLGTLGISERDADVERGRLANLRELLALAEPKVRRQGPGQTE